MKLVAVDPGKMTGWAEWDTAYELTCADQAPWEVFMDVLHDEVVTDDEVTLVIERYTITAQTLKKSRQYEALFCTGALLDLARRRRWAVKLQQPANVKALATDDVLRRLDWYTAGKDHARDATRHLVYVLLEWGMMDVKEVLDGRHG